MPTIAIQAATGANMSDAPSQKWDVDRAQLAGRQMPLSGSWICSIDSAVGEPVEGHGRAAGKNHASHDSAQLDPGEFVFFLPRQGGTQECKGQGKKGVTKANHLQ